MESVAQPGPGLNDGGLRPPKANTMDESPRSHGGLTPSTTGTFAVKFKTFKKHFDVYKKFPDYPDIIIILKIPIEVSISRKPDEHNNSSIIHNIGKKIEAIDNLDNLKDSIIIDAAKEYPEVLKSVKSFIWRKI